MKHTIIVLAASIASCTAIPEAEAPTGVRAVQYAIDQTVFLTEAGCTGVAVAWGVVLTAKHCVEDGAETNDNFDTQGGIVKYVSPSTDFAVIVYPDINQMVGTAYIPMRTAAIGEHIYVVGYPVQMGSRDQELTVTDGIVAGPANSDLESRITAPVYFGNSGGGVWSDDGYLVGIAVSIFAADLPSMRFPIPYPAQSFMVPVSEFRKHL